ncbi:hypothetical protein [Spirosoma aerophilum]
MRYLLVFLLLGAGQGLYAQTNRVTYDWQSRTYASSSNTCLPAGTLVTYELINVNTFAQKVRIDGQVVMVTTDMPAEFITLFRIKTDTEKKLDNTQDQVDKMEEVLKDATQNPVSKAVSTLVDSCELYYEEAEKIKQVLDLQEQLLSTMANKRFYNAVQMRAELKRVGIDSLSIVALGSNFQAFIEAYRKVYSQYGEAALVAHKANDKESEAKIESAKNQVAKDYMALRDLYQRTIKKIDGLYGNAVDPLNYKVESNPIKIASNVDELLFTIHVGDDTFLDAIYVKKSWKIDYSVGLVAKYISNENYFFDPNQTLRQYDKAGFFSTITPGIAPMLHLHRRTCNDISWGGMFGINADFKEITDINLGFLVGGFVMAGIGQTQKAIISGGLSYSNVNRLKAGEYSVGTVYKDVKIENVTERVLRPSFFLSISLAIPKREVKKIE